VPPSPLDHLEFIDYISFDAGGVLVYLDDVRMAELLTEFCGRPVTPVECMHTESRALADLGTIDPPNTNGLPHWAHQYFGGMAAQILQRDPQDLPKFNDYDDFVKRCFDLNVNGMLYSKIGPDAVETLARLKKHGFVLSVTSDASGQVARNFRTLGLDEYFEFILDSGVMGRSKPELYADLIERAGVPAGRILHVDNNLRLVRETSRYGLRGILYDPQDMYGYKSDGVTKFRNLLDMSNMLMGRVP